jgi:hypothetical protein
MQVTSVKAGMAAISAINPRFVGFPLPSNGGHRFFLLRRNDQDKLNADSEGKRPHGEMRPQAAILLLFKDDYSPIVVPSVNLVLPGDADPGQCPPTISEPATQPNG